MDYVLAVFPKKKIKNRANWLVDLLSRTDVQFAIEPSFEELEPFARSCVARLKAKTEIQDEIVEIHIGDGENAVTPAPGETRNTAPPEAAPEEVTQQVVFENHEVMPEIGPMDAKPVVKMENWGNLSVQVKVGESIQGDVVPARVLQTFPPPEKEQEVDDFGGQVVAFDDELGETTGNGGAEGEEIKGELITDFPLVLPDPIATCDLMSDGGSERHDADGHEYEDDAMDGGGVAGDSHDDDNQMEDSQVKVPKKRRSRRLAKLFVEKEGKQESMGGEGDREEEHNEESVCAQRGSIGTRGWQSQGDLNHTDVDESGDEDGEEKCPVNGCSAKFTSSEALVVHMKRHTSPWICGVCQRLCLNRANLRVHYISHSGEKPFKCGICHHKFSRQGNLQRHQQTKHQQKSKIRGNLLQHAGDEPTRCTVCKKLFTVPATLKAHMRSHTGEKPYACKNCGYKSAYNSDLTKHKKKYAH